MNQQTREEVIASIKDVSLRSAMSRGINIFELGTLDKLISTESAEEIRKEFTKHNTSIKQITNFRQFTSWTTNQSLVQNLTVKYVPKETCDITNEILIFDDTVAIYRIEPEAFYFEITDKSYAHMMRNIFDNIWYLGDSLLLTADGSTLTKQYLPISCMNGSTPVVIYPAKDDGILEKAFSRTEKGGIERYVNALIDKDVAYYKDADMILAYVWNQEEIPYCDVWEITRNTISDDSGLLYDVRIYKAMELVKDVGVASGNSSIVLVSEELLLRELLFKQGLSLQKQPIGIDTRRAFL